MYVDDETRLRHMLDAGRDAGDFARTHRREDLDAIQWAGLVKMIEVIGEAAGKVTVERRHRHPEVEWDGIIGMRHRLVHDYANIDQDIVWGVATDHLPRLVQLLEQIVLPWQSDPALICEAISVRRIVQFEYGGLRTIEPYTHGWTKAGTEMILGYQVAGVSSSGAPVGWKTFLVEAVGALRIIDQGFQPRPDFTPDDPRFTRLHCTI